MRKIERNGNGQEGGMRREERKRKLKKRKGDREGGYAAPCSQIWQTKQKINEQ